MLRHGAEDAAADAHREELADKLLHLGAVLAREQVEGRHPIRHGTDDLRAALEQQVRHGSAAGERTEADAAGGTRQLLEQMLKEQERLSDIIAKQQVQLAAMQPSTVIAPQ